MTSTSPARIDADAWSVTRTVRIDADRSRVWASITRPELIAQWFGQSATLDRLAVGGTGTFRWDGYNDDFPVLIVEFDPETVFAYRWGRRDEPLRDDNSTVARFTLSDDGDATLLTVVETGFDNLAGDAAHRGSRLEENRGGWDSELDELVAFLTSA